MKALGTLQHRISVVNGRVTDDRLQETRADAWASLALARV